MKTRTVRTVMTSFVLPGLAGFLVFCISCGAAAWECQIPGCTHWFKEALMLPNHYAYRLVEVLLFPLLAFADEWDALFIVLAGGPIAWIVTGVLVAWVIRCLRPSAY